LGRIDPLTNCLECPYHGWQFDGNGTLQRIPQLEPTAPLQAEDRSVQSFPVHATGDLLWVFLPTSFHGESFLKTLLPEDYYQGLGKFVDQEASFYTQDLPFSYDFLIEK
jgi:phenylpropionate dioxygenase-like ring-hydroxylating dioxygenase large terminal subunit